MKPSVLRLALAASAAAVLVAHGRNIEANCGIRKICGENTRLLIPAAERAAAPRS